jgi:hypothetical protein
MGDIIQGDRPWKISVQAMRLDTIERRLDEAMRRVEQCAEELKKIEQPERPQAYQSH